MVDNVNIVLPSSEEHVVAVYADCKPQETCPSTGSDISSSGELVPAGLERFSGAEDEAARLAHLATTVRTQDDLEKDIGRQADQMLVEQADERDLKRLEKTNAQKQKLISQQASLWQRLQQSIGSASSAKLQAEIEQLQTQTQALDADLLQIQKRIDDRHNEAENGVEATNQAGNKRQPGETRREFLIRTGKITPFSKIGQSLEKTSSSLADVLLEAEELGEEDENNQNDESDEQGEAGEPLSHRNLLEPGFVDGTSSLAESTIESIDQRPRKRRKLQPEAQLSKLNDFRVNTVVAEISEDDYTPDGAGMDIRSRASDLDSEDLAVPAVGTYEEIIRSGKRKPGKRKTKQKVNDDVEDFAGLDDGNEQLYQSRLRTWITGRKAARRKAQDTTAPDRIKDEDGADVSSDVSLPDDIHEVTTEEEWYLPHPTRTDTELDGGLRIPGDIYPSLFDYQKTGVQWLWELYSQQVGGIIGDEMGLGKTIQAISFLAGLHHSKKLTKPVIVVAPATVMKQWVNEFHRWWPPLRVSILHSSGSGMMDIRHERMLEDGLDSAIFHGSSARIKTPGRKVAKKIVDRVLSEGHVLVTTYSGLQSYAELLIPVDWGYAVLDEGHKIRNPNAGITIYCKELRTANRIILSGTPMQNNLTELWSLFDFIFPMRLGTLVNFRTQFEIPIKQGGYANASNLQVETALKCAETLKDAISPYLLQRFKTDVAADLPKKSEQVLFCRLTKLQREAYERFLESEEMNSILGGKRQALYGIDILRKISNHPDLPQHKSLSVKPGYNYGSGNKSGKMQVVKALLELWKDTGHKTLLFAQHRIMLDILEKFVKSLDRFNYCRMDGNTQIKDRQGMVDRFNRTPDLHVFLLTTKVGGLGINLTGADRVIIYDPDWNPSTDVQARERAWRLGQKREVMIYRLLTAGTIEEKIYHRQIFKQFLINKILRDPKQRQTFQLKDLHDLFTLGDVSDNGTETGDLFKGTEVKFEQEKTAPVTHSSLPTPPSEADDSSKMASIVGISHSEAFRGDIGEKPSSLPINDTDRNISDHQKNITSNSRLLSTIFARSGVHSALEHDAIVSGAGKPGAITADPLIIAREAKRVAAEAAKELQRSSELARHLPVGTPTWTGMVGVAGRPDVQPGPGGRGGFNGGRGRGGGPASSVILANLSARQEQAENSQQPKGKAFLALIRDYLLAHGGAVYTQMLIDHFNRYCGTPARTAEFKEMLRVIAVLDKGDGESERGRGGRASLGRRGRGGRGRWVLKKEFGGAEE